MPLTGWGARPPSKKSKNTPRTSRGSKAAFPVRDRMQAMVIAIEGDKPSNILKVEGGSALAGDTAVG